MGSFLERFVLPESRDVANPASSANHHAPETPRLAKLAGGRDYEKNILHGFTLAELETDAADDWPEIQNDPTQLEAFAHALRTTQTRLHSERPPHYTKAAECAHCGPVWLWEGPPDHVQGCPWCLNSGPVPRPGPVLCRDCGHWIPDTINPPGGLGRCEKNVPGLAWPWRTLECSQYRTSLLPSVA